MRWWVSSATVCNRNVSAAVGAEARLVPLARSSPEKPRDQQPPASNALPAQRMGRQASGSGLPNAWDMETDAIERPQADTSQVLRGTFRPHSSSTARSFSSTPKSSSVVTSPVTVP